MKEWIDELLGRLVYRLAPLFEDMIWMCFCYYGFRFCLDLAYAIYDGYLAMTFLYLQAIFVGIGYLILIKSLIYTIPKIIFNLLPKKQRPLIHPIN